MVRASVGGCELDLLLSTFVNVCDRFPHNRTEKNAFLAVCKCQFENANLDYVNDKCPYGGEIGPGRSPVMHKLFKRSKLFRVHAIFHDAYGYLSRCYDIGPGYLYALPSCKRMPSVLRNCCLLGQVAGVCYWLGYKLFARNHYAKLPF